MSSSSAEYKVGDRVVTSQCEGVVKYVGSIRGKRGVWYGIELDRPVGTHSGFWKGRSYFPCRERHGTFARGSEIELATTSDASSATAPDKKRRKADAALSEEQAAIKIQTAARGMTARARARDERLFQVWNELDQKDESELVHSYSQYQQVIDSYKTLRVDRSALPKVHGSVPTVMEDEKVPRLPEDTITLDFVTAMMDYFKHDGLLRKEDVHKILVSVQPLFKEQPNIVSLDIHSRLTVIGDIHGQLDDVFTIFKLNGIPSLRNSYLFNGDFVDRGQCSIECILTLLCFKLLYPDNMHLNRGNHEARDINSRDGFERECLEKYDAETFDLFSSVFAALPLAHVLNKEVFVVHGGLFWEDVTLDQIQKEDRFHEIPPVDSLMEQMMWSDPEDRMGRDHNPRGASLVFGGDVVDSFLELNNLSLIVRSHECQKKGYNLMFDDKLMTVFSASNYCGVVGNKGAFVIFEKDLTYEIVQFEAKAKEKISRMRMRYALIENDVISKLLRRIAENRLALVDCYTKMDKAKTGTITRVQWADGLKRVLGLNIPFLEFQSYLGLPKLGVRGRSQGDVDYMSFLDRFRIQLTFDDSKEDADLTDQSEAKSVKARLVELLLVKRYDLESLFRYFDANGDGRISIAELADGIKSLRSALNATIPDAAISSLLHDIDSNKDGEIQYEEFFDAFQVQDPNLATIQREASEVQRARRQHSGLKVKATATSAQA